jgi:hypothetical protein
VSFRSKDHECRIYVDKVNTSWQFKAASQALSNSKSLACSFWLNAWISFNKRYWPDQSQDVMPVRWSSNPFKRCCAEAQNWLKSTCRYKAQHSTAPQDPVCLSSLCTRSTARCILMSLYDKKVV